MDSAEPIDYRLRPVEIFPPTVERPSGRRIVGDVADVADLVGELHELGAAREPGGVLDLEALALRFEERLIVRYLGNDARHLGPEKRLELVARGLGVLDGVVENRPSKDDRVVDPALVREKVGGGERMVDVGRSVRILAELLLVFLGGEAGRS